MVGSGGWKQWQTLFSWAPKSLWLVTTAMKLKATCSLEEKLWQTQHIKRQRRHFTDKGPYSQTCGFSSRHVQKWKLDHKEGWASRNQCFQTVVLEKTSESPLHSKKTKPANSKGNQHWIFIGRTDAETEALVLWPSDSKIWLTEKDPDAGKDGRHWGKETGRRLYRSPWSLSDSFHSWENWDLKTNIHWKDWRWNWSSNPLVTWCKESTQRKRPW